MRSLKTVAAPEHLSKTDKQSAEFGVTWLSKCGSLVKYRLWLGIMKTEAVNMSSPHFVSLIILCAFRITRATLVVIVYERHERSKARHCH